ncbi:MAG: hypothetical protein RL490_1346 [Pseudomonadota bacterium]|jgi:hypothetical protein
MSNAADSHAALLAAIHAELAALEAEDAAAIEAATSAKVQALQTVAADIAAGTPVQREQLEQARDLNAEAALRARAKLISVERRLAAVTQVAAVAGGRPAMLTYGRDGRWA